jgi:ABC-type nitrate/sulfonate/bicarbonate transport system permease component
MLPHILVTAEEVVVGLAAGALLGVMMSALVAEFGVLRAFFVSHVMPSQTVPIATLAPILILWMGFEGGPKIALAALITFFPVLEHAVVGLRGSGLGPGMSGAAAHAPRWQSLWRFRFPHSIPFIVAGLRAAACPVIIGVVVGEYLGGERGLGYLMINAVNALNATLSLAVFVLIVVMSVGFYHALNGIERRLFERSWTGRERIASTMS